MLSANGRVTYSPFQLSNLSPLLLSLYNVMVDNYILLLTVHKIIYGIFIFFSVGAKQFIITKYYKYYIL